MEILTRVIARRYPQVRLVLGKNNEIVPTEHALEKAEEAGLDLVVVSDKSTPPVVRIQDFKKIQYEQKKARQKKGATSLQKEMQFKLNISDHDMQTKLSAIQRFLDKGNKVKIMVRLKGRERDSQDRVQELLNRVCEQVACKQSRLPGQTTVVILEPLR